MNTLTDEEKQEIKRRKMDKQKAATQQRAEKVTRRKEDAGNRKKEVRYERSYKDKQGQVTNKTITRKLNPVPITNMLALEGAKVRSRKASKDITMSSRSVHLLCRAYNDDLSYSSDFITALNKLGTAFLFHLANTMTILDNPRPTKVKNVRKNAAHVALAVRAILGDTYSHFVMNDELSDHMAIPVLKSGQVAVDRTSTRTALTWKNGKNPVKTKYATREDSTKWWSTDEGKQILKTAAASIRRKVRKMVQENVGAGPAKGSRSRPKSALSKDFKRLSVVRGKWMFGGMLQPFLATQEGLCDRCNVFMSKCCKAAMLVKAETDLGNSAPDVFKLFTADELPMFKEATAKGTPVSYTNNKQKLQTYLEKEAVCKNGPCQINTDEKNRAPIPIKKPVAPSYLRKGLQISDLSVGRILKTHSNMMLGGMAKTCAAAAVQAFLKELISESAAYTRACGRSRVHVSDITLGIYYDRVNATLINLFTDIEGISLHQGARTFFRKKVKQAAAPRREPEAPIETEPEPVSDLEGFSEEDSDSDED